MASLDLTPLSNRALPHVNDDNPSVASLNVTSLLNSTNDIDHQASLFVSPSEHLNLPPNFFRDLKKHGAAYVLTEERETIIVYLSLIKKVLPNVEPAALENILQNARLELSQVLTSGPVTIRQEIVDANTIQVGDCFGDRESVAWYLLPEMGEMEWEDWTWLKTEIDLHFDSEPLKTSFWSVAWNGRDLDPNGKDICPSLGITFCHRDGIPHHVWYSAPTHDTVLNSDHGDYDKPEVVNYGDDSSWRNCDEDIRCDDEEGIRELDIPDVVHEVISGIQSSFFLPNLQGSQAHALQARACQYLQSNSHRHLMCSFQSQEPEHQRLLAIIQGSESIVLQRHAHSRIAQAMFLLNWRLHLSDFQRVGGLRFCSDPVMCRNSRQPCYDFVIYLRDLECYLIKEITSAATLWVLRIVCEGHLATLSNANSLHERMKMWNRLMNNVVLGAIFEVLSPGVDVTAALECNQWNKVLTVALIRLADDILLFQVAQGSTFEPFSMETFTKFWWTIRGKEVSRQVVVTTPPPVHASIREAVRMTARDGDTVGPYSVPLAFDLQHEEYVFSQKSPRRCV